MQLNSGENLTITNRDIVWWNGPDCEFYEAWTDGYYLYLIISHAFLQAGSLGIWCPNKCDWLFTKRADWFCVDAIIYIPDKDLFFGCCQWETPMHAGSGVSFFQIDSLGTFTELQKIPKHTAHSQAEKSINCSSIYGKKYFGYSSEVDVFFLSSDQNTNFFKLEHAWQ